MNTAPHNAPGPRAWPLLGNLPELRGDILQVLLRMHRRHGDLFGFRTPGQQFYAINHPDYARHVLVTQRDNYIKDGRSNRQIRLLAGQSLLTDNAEPWHQKRDLLQNTFKVDQVRQFAPLVADEAQTLLQSWRQSNEPIDMHQQMMHITYQVIGRALFSEDMTQSADEVAQVMHVTLHHLYQRIFGLAFALSIPTIGNLRFLKARRRLHALVDGIIARRLNARHDQQHTATSEADLLARMIAALNSTQQLAEQSHSVFSPTWLRDEVVTLLLAGHETTANALTWFWYLLAEHPEVEQQVYAEIQQYSNEPLNNPALLSRHEYTQRVLLETLRLYPPIWSIERSPLKEDQIAGYRIEAGATVFITIYGLHRHPDFWPNPERFDPERFVDPKRAQDAYMPFGLGPRMCLGKNFAMQEALLIIISLLRQCRPQRVEQSPVVARAGITLRVRDPLRMRLQWRD